MARDNRVIKSNIRQGGEKYGPGREDELASVLTQERLDQLVESGALEGDWTHLKAEAAEENSSNEETTPEGEQAPDNAPVGESVAVADTDEGKSDGPALTPATREKLEAASIATDESLRTVSDDDLKAAGLAPVQVKNVRSVFGEFVAPTE